MSEIPDDFQYTSTHEWVHVGPDGTATVGITDFAQQLAGNITFIALPRVGERLTSQEACAVVESSKVACEVRCPFSGTVTAINEELAQNWSQVNAQPYAAWLVQLHPTGPPETATLLDADGYRRLLQDSI
jgi:glycine cleavage system H protein